jgi:hypothetical protein
VRYAGEHAIAMESGEDAYPLVSHTRQRTSKTYLCGTVTTELVRRLRTLCATQ